MMIRKDTVHVRIVGEMEGCIFDPFNIYLSLLYAQRLAVCTSESYTCIKCLFL